MADVTVAVRVPGLLARFTGGDGRVTVRASTVGGAVDALLAAHPELEPHLHDGGGRLRTHLRLFHEGREVAEAADGVPVSEGDEVVVLQAVSGGSSTAGFGAPARERPLTPASTPPAR